MKKSVTSSGFVQQICIEKYFEMLYFKLVFFKTEILVLSTENVSNRNFCQVELDSIFHKNKENP